MSKENTLLKVGDAIEFLPADQNHEESFPENRQSFTIVKILDKSVDKQELDKIMSSEYRGERTIDGENLLDDPRFIGKISEDKIYFIET